MPMKSSYTDSLITVAAAVAQACSLQINRQKNIDAPLTCKDPSILKLKTANNPGENRVGIKFDNISAIKYFILIRSLQQHTAINNK